MWRHYKTYQLHLDQEQVAALLGHLDIHDKRRVQKILRIARATSQWGDALYEKVTRWVSPERISIRTVRRWDHTSEREYRRIAHDPFSLWLLQMVKRLTALGTVTTTTSDKIYDGDRAYLHLGYHPQADAATMGDDGSYLVGGRWLLNQLTVALNDRLAHLPSDKVTYMIGRVARRQNPDSTHLRSFTQLEMRVRVDASRALDDLEDYLITTLVLMGLPRDRLCVRPTLNHYTAPSIQVFYITPAGKYLQVANGGVFLRQMYDQLGLPWDEFRVPVGFGVGLQRIYMITKNISRIAEI